jgi:hypothetical protein
MGLIEDEGETILKKAPNLLKTKKVDNYLKLKKGVDEEWQL